MTTGSERLESASELPEDLGGDLEGLDLRGRNLSGLSFQGRDLSGVILEGASLVGTDFRDAGLSSANLSGADLTGARLDGADLSGADLTRTNLSTANLSGAVLERALLHETVLRDAQVQNSSWNDADARVGDWTGVDLRGAGLYRTHLVDLDLRKAQLEGAHIDDSDLIRVKLEGAQILKLKLTDSTLKDVDFRDVSAEAAEFRFANFDSVDFRGADFRAVQFESVAFKSCEFSDFHARGASFVRCAGLRSAVLDQLGDAGAEVALPLVLRLWRMLSERRGGRAALLVVLLVAVALVGYEIWTRVAAVPENELEIEFLLGADEQTRREWQDLKLAYERQPETRHETLVQMAERLERLGFGDEAERRLREAISGTETRPDQGHLTRELQGRLGIFLLRQKRYEDARLIANTLLSEASTGEERALGQDILVDALLGAGRLLIEQREYDLAFDYARAIIDGADSPLEQAPGYLLIAQARAGMGDNPGALQELSQLTSHFGSHPGDSVELRMEGARLLRQLGEVSAGLSLLQGVPQTVPVEERSEVDLLRAEILTSTGNTLMAVRVYDTMLESYEDFPLITGRAREARSAALTGDPDPETQRRQLESLAEAADPTLAIEGELGLARLSIRRGNRDEAFDRYHSLLQRFSDQPELSFRVTRELAELYVASGDIEQAGTVLQEAVDVSTVPEFTVELREDLSGLWQGAGEYDQAREVLERTLRDFADQPSYVTRAKLHLAGVEDQAGEVSAATVLYREVASAQLDPEMTAAALFGEATLLRRVGKGTEALPLMDQSLEVLPKQSRFRGTVAVERAELLVELGRGSVSEVEGMLAEAREAGFDQDQPVAFGELLLLLADEMQAAERHEDALRIYQRVGSSSGATEDSALKQAGIEGEVGALVALGRKDQADELLRRVQVSSMSGGEAADNCDARLSLARGRSEMGDTAGGAEEFREILEVCRSPRFLVANLAVMSDLLVDGGAEETAQELLASVRDADLAPAGKQAAQLELGRLGSVDDLELAAKGPDPALAALALVARGEQLAQEGRLAEAEPLWGRVVEDQSTEPVPRSLALLGLARLEAARGRPMASKGHLEEVRTLAVDPWLIAEADRLMKELAVAPQPAAALP
ncbi:MAG: pentapeptide repeat-containing protein [Myxococcota bacterium]|nr:pentapeptide repeat-containing protein [Myxococcota bacterium]